MSLESKIAKIGTHSSQEVFMFNKGVEVGSIIKFKFSKQKYDKFHEGRVYRINEDGMIFIELI